MTRVDKARVFKSFALFWKVSEELVREFPAIGRDAAHIDATGLDRIRRPGSSDVLATEAGPRIDAAGEAILAEGQVRTPATGGTSKTDEVGRAIAHRIR